MPSVKRMAVITTGVIAGSFAVGPLLEALKIERSDGFGLDDVLAAAVIAAGVLLVDSFL